MYVQRCRPRTQCPADHIAELTARLTATTGGRSRRRRTIITRRLTTITHRHPRITIILRPHHSITTHLRPIITIIPHPHHIILITPRPTGDRLQEQMKIFKL
ncbi:hypothetical protein MSG28_009686 [Choristoneura fumiferana]|uniref:Uncharacterized protein n=1 Tax=Choristoneura fumiferana TaxID=7141 RepID=A0ACC0JC45_CHOFU|nr:hypothetical protein MSG28_009686 [Choristoneura fumiferana]